MITDVRNTTDSTIQVKTMGKTLQIDGNSSIQLDPIAVKGCKKPLKLKLDARAVGDRDHYALDYNDRSCEGAPQVADRLDGHDRGHHGWSLGGYGKSRPNA